jgi:uncharacterized membrane protein affecting hemolysin expression
VNAEVVLVALIVSLISPTVLAWINGRQRRADKQEDWARQDAVAAQAAEAASLLLAENKKVAESAQTTHDQLTQIHTLVNSNMTASMQADHDSTVLLLAALRANVALRGGEANEDTRVAIKTAEGRLAELEAQLTDRRAATKVAGAAAAG